MRGCRTRCRRRWRDSAGPARASGAGASCGTAAGTGNIDALVTLPVGTSATFTVSGTVPAGTTGSAAQHGDGDAAARGDRSGAGQQQRDRHQPGGAAGGSDASPRSSSPNPYVPGAPLTYTVVVTNAGPSNVTNARVQDALPAALAGFSWTCTRERCGCVVRHGGGYRRHRCAGDAAGGHAVRPSR